MNPQDLLSKLMGNPGASAAAGGFLGGSLAGMVTSKKGRKGLKKVATYGGLAALGVMAYQAFQRSKNPQAAPAGPSAARGIAAPPPLPVSDAEARAATRAATEARFLPPPEQSELADNLAANLLAAMISAARADGVLDADEQQKIHAQLGESDLASDEKAQLLDLMSQPADPHRIARLAGSEEEGAELYLASVLAIEPDHWAEQAYLQTLRDALGLDPAFARELEAGAAQQRAGVA